MRTLTDEQIDQMATWREAGKSYKWISLRLGISPGAIRWQCLRVGADHPRGHKFAASQMPMVTVRGGVTVRRFTPEEDALILSRKAEGARTAEIARELVATTQATVLPVQEDLAYAAAAIRNLRGTLDTISGYMASGRITEAKVLVDALVGAIDGSDRKAS